MNAAVFILLFTVARGLLFWRNRDLLGDIPHADVFSAFATAFRFDLIVTCYALAPLVLTMLLPSGLSRRRWCNGWLVVMALVYSFLAALELDFYHEFHARLNSLVFQYVKEDPETVVNMLWYGFPVLRYLALCLTLTGICAWAIWRIDAATRRPQLSPSPYRSRLVLALILIFSTAAAARGTFRSGPPLRWADAYKTEHLFTNHLALNGSFTLLKAAQEELDKTVTNPWLKMMPDATALQLVRENWVMPQEKLLAPESLPLFRHVAAAAQASPDNSASPYKNVVLIIDESFSAQRTGVFGNTQQITPHFDAIAHEGLLFERFFSQGTHTHQGMFATAACFPNLPHYEYLMKQPQGANNFSGITKLLAARGYKSLYVHNGDFAWDNQSGFFRAQNMQRFIGRFDFVNPRFSDRTWGVSDEDMFDRGFEEIVKLQHSGKPYFAMLRTLSNHAPFALPPQLPMPAVEIDGVRDEHLTAMRYNDYALGVFFDRITAFSRDNTHISFDKHALLFSSAITALAAASKLPISIYGASMCRSLCGARIFSSAMAIRARWSARKSMWRRPSWEFSAAITSITAGAAICSHCRPTIRAARSSSRPAPISLRHLSRAIKFWCGRRMARRVCTATRRYRIWWQSRSTINPRRRA